MCGRITNAVWPDVESAPFYKKAGWEFIPDDWKAKEFGRVDEMSLDFVRSMLQADPTRRPTAADVVASTFWVTPVRQYGSDGDVRMDGVAPFWDACRNAFFYTVYCTYNKDVGGLPCYR